ncbi:hypothetical protein Tco_1078278, partial [Tanacetum coccineum]
EPDTVIKGCLVQLAAGMGIRMNVDLRTWFCSHCVYRLINMLYFNSGHTMVNFLYLGVSLEMYHKEEFSIVKGSGLVRIVYDGWNRECVQDEPSWSTQYTITGALFRIVRAKNPQIPIGDGDGDVKRILDEDGGGDGDEAEKRGWDQKEYKVTKAAMSKGNVVTARGYKLPRLVVEEMVLKDMTNHCKSIKVQRDAIKLYQDSIELQQDSMKIRRRSTSTVVQIYRDYQEMDMERKFAPQLHESAGGLPKTKLVSHSCSLARSTSAMEVSIPIAFVLLGREHECNESFTPPALS